MFVRARSGRISAASPRSLLRGSANSVFVAFQVSGALSRVTRFSPRGSFSFSPKKKPKSFSTMSGCEGRKERNSTPAARQRRAAVPALALWCDASPRRSPAANAPRSRRGTRSCAAPPAAPGEPPRGSPGPAVRKHPPRPRGPERRGACASRELDRPRRRDGGGYGSTGNIP